MEIRPLTEADAQTLWNLRATALRSEPDAFGESVEEHLQTPIEVIASQLKAGGNEGFVLGAFRGPELVGMVGFQRDSAQKRRHRSRIWGMYVIPEVRGKGFGRALLEEALRRAERIAGLRSVVLSVSRTQTTASALYGRLGFRIYGTEPQALGLGTRFIDEDQMILLLPEHPEG